MDLKVLLHRRARDHQSGRIRTWEKVPFAERLPFFIDIPMIFRRSSTSVKMS
jgi:hypothetical protein